MRIKIRIFIILLLAVLFLVAGYHYIKGNDKDTNQTKETEKDNNEETNNCSLGYKCETIDGVEYKWTTKKSIRLSNVYNYDTDELEAGVLKINNGKLEFLDLTNKVIKVYSEIEGNVIAIEESIDMCDEKPIYIALTDNGKLYISDAGNGMLVSEAFNVMDSDNKFVEFMIKVNSTEYVCTITEIYAKTSDGKVIKLVSNENVTE